MLSHDRIWAAIDALAARYGMSASGLARKAGLDATSFNRSKRTSLVGRDRWPSTESISKILRATGASLDEFMKLVEPDVEQRLARMTVPLVGMAQAGAGRLFDAEGMPAGANWDEIDFPDLGGEKVFALEVTGESMMPLYRDGDILVISPTASVRKGDRVVVRTGAGEVMVKELKRKTAKSIELLSLNPKHAERTLSMREVLWIARIVWASQ
jgi:phage repressor protein C with HTH and peptisase S24 domain